MNKISKILILLMILSSSVGIASAETMKISLSQEVSGMKLIGCNYGSGNFNPSSLYANINNQQYHLNDIITNEWKLVGMCTFEDMSVTIERGSYNLPTPQSTTPVVTNPLTYRVDVDNNVIGLILVSMIVGVLVLYRKKVMKKLKQIRRQL